MLTTKLSDNITEKILKSIDKEAYKYNPITNKEDFIKRLTEVCNEIERRKSKCDIRLRHMQQRNFEVFAKFKKEVVDMLSEEDQRYFYILQSIAINGDCVVGNKHIEVLNKVKELSEKYGYVKNWRTNWINESAYGAALNKFCKNSGLI